MYWPFGGLPSTDQHYQVDANAFTNVPVIVAFGYSPNSIALYNADAGDLEYTFGLSMAQLDEAPELIAEMLGLELKRRPNGDIVLR